MEGENKYTEKELCDTIRSLYPDIGACGIDLTVRYDEEHKAWLVHLEKDGQELKHYLEEPDAAGCVEGKQCVALGLEIAQLKNNIEGQQF